MNEEENLGGAVDAPENTNLGESNDTPTETPVEETPVEAPVTEAPIEGTSTETPAETPIDSPVASPITAAPESKKGGMGWKIATFAFLATTILCCGALAFLVFSDGKTIIFNRTISSMSSDKAKQQNSSNNVEEPADTPDEQKKEDTDTKTNTSTDCPSTEPTKKTCDEINLSKYKNDVAGLMKAIGNDFSGIKKIEYTNDSKYLIAVVDLKDAAGVWYKTAGTGSWTKLHSGQNFIECSKFTDAQKQFMKDYKYFDDDLGSRYLGCYESASGDKIFPE